MTLGLGYVAGLVITSVFLLAVLSAQIRAERYHIALFWLAIVATTARRIGGAGRYPP